jgi:hypothetical protein
MRRSIARAKSEPKRPTAGFKTAVQTATDPSDIDLNDLESDLDGQLDRFTNLGLDGC